MESLGVSSGKKPQQQINSGNPKDSRNLDKGPVDQLNAAKDQQAKQAVARAALAQLAGGTQRQKEPTVWEKAQQEAEQKKELAKQQQKQATTQQLPAIQSKRKRGDLYGMKAKRIPRKWEGTYDRINYFKGMLINGEEPPVTWGSLPSHFLIASS